MTPPRVALVALAAAMIGAALAAWLFYGHGDTKVGVAVPLPPAKAVAGQKTAPVAMKSVEAYAPEVKRKAKLPAAVAEDDTKHLIASGKLDAEERPYNFYAVVDETTGESRIYSQAEPLPWLALGRRGAVGITYGLSNGELEGKLYAYQDLLKVKALAAGVRAEIDTSANHYVGAYVEYRF